LRDRQRDDWERLLEYRPELRDSVVDVGDVSHESVVSGWGRSNGFELVGQQPKTDEYCGRYLILKGCLGGEHGEEHNKVVFDKYGNSVNCAGKAFLKLVHHFCDKPSCCVCFRHWAKRGAGKIESRLAVASKRFGLVEHIIVGVPSRDWVLSYEQLRKKCHEVLYSRGVIGGALVFHPFRYADVMESRVKHVPFGWYWSPHFHVLGFIRGGYGECRGCFKRSGKPCVKGCGGFVDRNFRLNEVDGWYVKVKGKRRNSYYDDKPNVFGTAFYELNHAGLKVGSDGKPVTRYHVFTWFGVCSYRRLKITVEKFKDLCPICGGELYKIYNFGSRVIVKDVGASGYVGSFLDDLFGVDGSPNYVKVVSGSFG